MAKNTVTLHIVHDESDKPKKYNFVNIAELREGYEKSKTSFGSSEVISKALAFMVLKDPEPFTVKDFDDEKYVKFWSNFAQSNGMRVVIAGETESLMRAA